MGPPVLGNFVAVIRPLENLTAAAKIWFIADIDAARIAFLCSKLSTYNGKKDAIDFTPRPDAETVVARALVSSARNVVEKCMARSMLMSLNVLTCSVNILCKKKKDLSTYYLYYIRTPD